MIFVDSIDTEKETGYTIYTGYKRRKDGVMELENQITSILFYAAEQYSLFNQILLCECECLWNLKKKHVHHIYNDLVFMNYIDTYVKLCGEFSSSFDHPYIARSRVKNRLSIQQKIERYMFEKEDGNIL